MSGSSGRETDAPGLPLTAGDVARIVGGDLVRGPAEVAVRGVAIDSRTVSPGMLFVALGGAETDGHHFVGEAFRRGAAAALVSRGGIEACGTSAVIRVPETLRGLHRLARAVRDRLALRVIGISGSVGKTSTKEMAAGVVSQAFRTARSPENWNTEIGIPLVLVNMPEDREVAVLELAMRGPGQIRELVEIAAPDIGVVTNVGQSHLDFFPSREALAAAKGELIEGLPAGGCAILNAEDPLAWDLRHRARARTLSFGLQRGDVRAEAIRVVPTQGSAFRLRTPSGSAPVTLRVPGRHSVQNALAAAAVGVALGIDAAVVAAGLEQAVPLPMRLEIVRAREIVLLSDVYNSSPQSVAAALDVMDEVDGSPRVVVLGDMKELGARSAEAHRRVGREIARRRVDLVIAFGPLAAELATAAREAGAPRVEHTESVEQVTDRLLRALRPGAVVLIKGSRAMAMERITAALGRPAPTGAPASGGSA